MKVEPKKLFVLLKIDFFEILVINFKSTKNKF